MPDDPEIDMMNLQIEMVGKTLFLQITNDPFLHCCQLTDQKNYDEKNITHMKQMFTAEGHEEELKLIKLEQDARDKQLSDAKFARKRVNPTAVQAYAQNQEARTEIIHTPSIYIDPRLKFQQEMKERLARYGIKTLHNVG